METDLALLADAATIDASGKINILGIFDRISVGSFPARHPRLCLVLRFQAGIQESGAHVVEITFRRPGGEELVRLDGEMRIAPGPEGIAGAVRVPHILNLDGLVLPEPGLYGFDVRVDGAHLATIPLAVHGPQSGAEA